ncbi:MAG: tRNA (adenosine(37)-N6)-threonylcarbamoyltransferase complex dimerization subunit type 1 TsaB [Chloroflexi bacterium]|nr:tRNA (adenosine(37)-N6)-threonylcarbamoyltransferase complex dimerization subunit type 1 TsaB [Chloroflexota bacterium]
MYLALDTSTDFASIALSDEERILAELTWLCGQNHTTELLPRLSNLLEQSRTDIKSVAGIIVALGPGSYNGLRAGVTTAKGLALSLDVPLVGVSTLEVEAYPHAVTGLPVCAIHDAGRNEIATATYQMRRGKWQRLTEERITTLEDLCAQITVKTMFCGELPDLLVSQLTAKLGTKALIPAPAARLRRAAFLAELGVRRLKMNDYDDPAILQPLYLRRPSITQRIQH